MNKKSLNFDTLITVLNEVGAYIYTKDLNGKYTYANSLVLELFETSLDELIGKDDCDFFNEEEVKELLENDKKVFSGEIIETEEILTLKGECELKYFIVVKKPLYDENQNIIGMFGISTDITKQKILEKKILEQKTFLDTILDNVDAYIYMKDENRTFRYANSKVAELFRLPSEKIIGQKDSNVISKEAADSFWESDKQVLDSNEKIITEEHFENENIHTYYWSIKLPYLLEDNTRAVIGFSTDITQLKEQAKEIKEKDTILHQQAKNIALGEMLENIAHQWRQPLSAISSITSGIKLKKLAGVYDEKDLAKELQSITNAVNFLSETIDYFRGFMKDDNLKTTFKIEDIINKTLELILVDLKNHDIQIVTSFEDEEIHSYQNEFIQILINLISNAKDAFHENNIKEKIIFIEAKKENNFLNLKIKDTAKGIEEKNIDRIFEPYFTTKHKSQGTGIGLFMCQQIAIKSLKGKLSVSNCNYSHDKKNYTGACFTLSIPLEEN